jgi:competence protein ComGC
MAELSNEHQILKSEKNSCGVIGLVLSIAGLVLCGLWLLTIPGVILSLIGLRKEPRKAATTGTIIGGVGILIFPLIVAILLPLVSIAQGAAKRATTYVHMHTIQSASDEYHADYKKYPSSFDDLEKGAYITSDSTQDAWGKQMQFKGSGDTKPTITSAGEDGAFGTVDDLKQQN